MKKTPCLCPTCTAALCRACRKAVGQLTAVAVEELLSPEQAAPFLRRTVDEVRELCRTGRIEHRRFERSRRLGITHSAIAEFLEREAPLRKAL